MNYKLRIKHQSGAEFEAEGPAEFILNEKEGFLKSLPAAQEAAPGTGQRPLAAPEPGQEPDWSALADDKNGSIILRNKHLGLKAGAAALLILAAEAQLKGSRELSAIALSKAVKTSGYTPGRLDRVLAKALKEGLVKASGTKRNRAYQITDRGLEMAWLEAKKLAK
ncbi:MAG TPA: hypothetical protein DEQ38_12815 [Elusimicrobia bacterium]|nr:MAG: hypothetical protein A2089_10605 [Elusimicrobia bacterium GWD2_63_28]HCC48980.1 hypothetical protein [Elusimicrobiota bacterium]